MYVLVEDDGHGGDHRSAARRVRAATADAHGFVPDGVVVLPRGAVADRDDAEAPVPARILHSALDGALHTDFLPVAATGAPAPGARAPVPPAPSRAVDVEEVRETVAALLGRPLSEVGPEDDLIGLGIDSLRTMQFANDQRAKGFGVRFPDLFARPTVRAWTELLALSPGTGSPDGAGPAAAEGEPFPLTPVQHAYWIGRRDDQVLGGVACHFYVELDGRGLRPRRLERALRALIQRHPALRTAYTDDGGQRVLPEPRVEPLETDDLRHLDQAEADRRLEERRERLSHRLLDIASGQVLAACLSLLPDGGHRLHLNFELLATDVQSIRIALVELAELYRSPRDELPPLGTDFASYLAARESRRAPSRDAHRDYWASRVPELPGPPQLPLAADPARAGVPRFERREHRLGPERRERLAGLARAHGATVPMVLAAAFAEVVGAWSAIPRFLLNLPLFDREALDGAGAGVEGVVADFTNLVLVAFDLTGTASFADRVAAAQACLREHVAHSDYSGVEVLRDLTRRGGPPAPAPVVFTSAVGMGELIEPRVREVLGETGWMISQTPQVWLDHQVVERDGGLALVWDAVSGLFPEGVLDAMFDAYGRVLEQVLAGDWSIPVVAVPTRDHLAVRTRVNEAAMAASPLTDGVAAGAGLLHGGFFAWAEREPDRVAVVWDGGRWTYAELAERALRTAAHLSERGARPGDTVAVSLPKGPDQVAAVLGVLAAGCAYVPVGVDQPALRRERMLRRADAALVLDDLEPVSKTRPWDGPTEVPPEASAYVIFTSGSTGEPKGVEVTHRAAVNTVTDVCARFGIGPDDRVLAVSALDFDLSVFDVFGLLGVGGAVVVPEEEQRRDAAAWCGAVSRHGVTVWNTVPVLAQMLVEAATGAPESLAGLRVVMVSGDWVPLDLPGQVTRAAPDCRFVAMGGATEAAIWSNYEEVGELDPDWPSIPYGRPLSGQCFRVVGPDGRDRPDWVPGELWIGGAGVAVGYRGDPATTAARFVTDERGVRWYRTGDQGRYRPDGRLEFLGRDDHQIKIRGHRLELGEVEAAARAHPRITSAAVVVSPAPSPRLVAFVTVTGGGTAPEALRDFLAERLPEHAVPAHVVTVPRIPLNANGKVDRAALTALAGEQVGRTAATGAPPEGPTERAVADIWADLLGLDTVNRDDNFFTLGGDSLLATRMIVRLNDRGLRGADLGLLFSAGSLREFARGLRDGTGEAGFSAPVARPEERHEPFPLTSVQQAYRIGRGDDFALGGVDCHFYTEYDGADIDLARLEEAWNLLILRHDMLRAVLTPDGRQRVLPEVPRFAVPVTDASDEDAGQALADLRAAMSHQLIDPHTWPLFDLRAVRYGGGRVRLGLSIDALTVDALSAMILLGELDRLYADPKARLAPLGLTFRDYVLGVHPSPERRERAERHWAARVRALPGPPELPLATDPSLVRAPRFERREQWLDTREREALLAAARAHGVTASAVLATAFCETLGAWSANPHLTINLTLFDRRDVHPDVGSLVGDFTSLLLAGYQPEPEDSWAERVTRLHRRMGQDLDHSEVTARWVLSELARHRGSLDVSMPVVFTSTIGATGTGDAAVRPSFAEPVWGVSQTPQVWLDHQVVERDGGLALVWDAVSGLFPEGVLDAMFDAYGRVLRQLLDGDWTRRPVHTPPPEQLLTRERVNRIAADTPVRPASDLLHGGFFAWAEREPDRVAVVWDGGRWTYAELAERALRTAAHLNEHGARPGDTVAVSLPKGPDQVAAVLGVLAAGCAYVPVGVDQPALRRERMLRRADAALVLDDLGPALAAKPWKRPARVGADASAYVIFTSGSTGEPKGVEVTHRAAVNTVTDVCARFGIGPDDRVLAVSALDFDLSVFDVFGLLGVGGAVVVPAEEQRRDAAAWCGAVSRHGVTVWNTVPVLAQMLTETAAGVPESLAGLHVVMVSGDWVPLDLPRSIEDLAPGCRFVAMGGATEAAIWSNYEEVGELDPDWPSIPYGRPLSGQCFRVVGPDGRDRPDWVPGELWIGGAGVAVGYRGDPATTAARFVTDEHGTRWYRTGDQGRYRPDGRLEFLGRDDHQIKIRGHRLELGEVEAAARAHPEVGTAAVVVSPAPSPRLVAFVTAVEGREAPDSLRDFLAERLPEHAVPAHVVTVPRMPLNANGKVDRAALTTLAGQRAGNDAAAGAPPEGPTERAVADIWADLLGLDTVNRDDDFVALGGDSLLATRMTEALRRRFGAELPLRRVFEAPTVRALAALLDRGPSSADHEFEEGTL
ncbi:amino acid adenylation domain-containing protein [Nocardiopsis dassonvillei]|uniref:amino acid adenylation domain-containing protein n=1 Tax=Nocardiopsis dassonvillei TaxID=2014 RepID=UPI003F5648B8